MSKEMKLVQGDINISNGKIQTLTGIDKLEQQVLKILITSKDGKFHPDYGSDISNVIGRYEESPDFLVPLLRSDVDEALTLYQNIQINQEFAQEMDDDEVLMRLDDLEVERYNQTDYLVTGTIVNRSGVNAELSFSP